MSTTQQMSWNEWVAHNLERNCDPSELKGILLNNGFDADKANSMLHEAMVITKCDDERIDPSSDSQSATAEAYLPTAIRLATEKAEIYGIDGFLNEQECMQLIQLVRSNLRHSTTTEEGVSKFRTSKTCELASMDHPLVEEIDQRICAYMGIPVEESEAIQGQLYEVGQEFQPHTDYFEPRSATYAEHIGTQGQRSWTFMIYLNSTREGGSTHFPQLGLNIKPAAGTALVWNNLDSDGSLNENTLHHGTPVEAGYKAVITKWFRAKETPLTYSKELNELLPPLTSTGFLKTSMPTDLHNELRGFYQSGRENADDEHIPEFIVTESDQVPSTLVELTDELRAKVHVALKPEVEAWVGDYLEPTFVYGIREYRNGAVLNMHRDRLRTHVASVILNIDQNVDEDWPLTIEDHQYRRHQITLKPGEMVLYEGARLSHGRPEALRGQRYANVFVHFKLEGISNTDS